MSVQIERRGNRIHLTATFRVARLGETVPGSRFSMENGAHWTVPLTTEACRALRKKFGSSLRVGNELSTWYREEMAREANMSELAAAADANLLRVPEVSPVLAKAMEARTYQRVGARFIAEGWARGGILLADHPGLGKTLEVIGGIIESGVPGPYLVVCPKTAVRSVWGREIPRWWPGAEAITLPDGREKRNEILDEVAYSPSHFDDIGPTRRALYLEAHRHSQAKTFVVINPEMARTKSWWVCNACGHKMKWKAGPKKFECECGFDVDNPPKGRRVDEHEFPQLFAIEWGAIVADESDRVLIRRTGTPTQVRTGMELLRTRADGARIPASGTPDRSRPQLLWGTLNWIYPAEFTSAWRFYETFWDVRKSGWAGARTLGPMRDPEGLDRLLSKVMLRRTKAEVAPDLPAKTYVGTPVVDGDPTSMVAVWLDMDPAQQRLYDQMQAASQAVMEGGNLSAIGILAEMTRLKQFASSAGRVDSKGSMGEVKFTPLLPSNKFEYMWEKMEELGFPDNPETKIVFASQFTELVDLFMAELERRLGVAHLDQFGRPVKVTGKVTGGNRDRAIQDFNAPVGSHSPHVMGLNTTAGGVAITLDTADHMFIADRTWVPANEEQLEDRIHRVSRPRPVFYHYMHSNNSIEEAIAIANSERAAESHEVLDGRRGVEYHRRIITALRGSNA